MTAETTRVKSSRLHEIEVDYAPSAETIGRLEAFRSTGAPVVSAYVTVEPGPEGRRKVRSETDSLLHQIRPLAEDRELAHDARLSLRADIQRIEAVGEGGPYKAGTLAVFSCYAEGLFEVIGLPRALGARIVVDAAPAMRLMLAVLDEYHRCLAVVVDRETAYAWELYLGEVIETDALPGSKTRGVGRTVNERRNEHKAEEVEKRHFRAVARELEQLFQARGHDVMAVGGHAEELPRFLALLPQALRERVVGTFAIDHHSVSPATARERAEEILHNYELEEHRRSLEAVLVAAAAGGPATVGLESCLWAVSVRAIEALYVQEGASSPGVVCDESRWFGLSGERCPVCGQPTRPAADVIDELVEATVADGGSIHHVEADGGLAGSLVAASLRFELPPAPTGGSTLF
jgi:hypothetical protein